MKNGLINMARQEGDVGEWRDKLPAQFLSKQSLQLAKRQLGIAIDDKQAEINADREAKIAQLENQKTLLQAQRQALVNKLSLELVVNVSYTYAF